MITLIGMVIKLVQNSGRAVKARSCFIMFAGLFLVPPRLAMLVLVIATACPLDLSRPGG
jgi:membrane-associated PAP2 superfamily phosphatase